MASCTDLHADPGEVRNLWDAAEHRPLRESLAKELLEWSMRGGLRSRMPDSREPQQPMLI